MVCASNTSNLKTFNKFKLVTTQHLWIIIVLLCVSSYCDGALPSCPTDSRATINSPCRFSPGIHSYLSLIINSDVYFETTVGASQHTIKVNQTLEIISSAILQVGLNEGSSNKGKGVSHSNGGTGGSYGGRGGTAFRMSLTASQAVPYGNPFNVSDLGSQGGGMGYGKGGGFLQLEARKLIHNGIVKATGGRASNSGGGGSGGGIAIYCFEIDGTGKVESLGGLGNGVGGGGSGGRISITYRQGTYRWTAHTYGGKTARLISSQSGSRSASSEYVDSSFRRYYASYGVLNYQGSVGGWKPNQNSVNEYLQVTLSNTAYVTAVVTQGQYGGSEYVKTYYLRYNDVDVPLLRDYKENGERRVFSGNSDTNTPKRNSLEFPVHTKVIHFVPLTWNQGIVMRVDVEGFISGPSSLPKCDYTLPQDGSTEAGGPGTVFVDGFKGGAPERVLLVDNIGSNARVSSSSDNDIFKMSGAVAWLPVGSSPPQLERVSLTRGAQILLTGSSALNVNDVTTDGSGHLYVSSGVRLQINNRLSPCTKVFNGGEFIIPKGSSTVNLERNLAMYGKLTLLNSPTVSFGKYGGALAMHPGSSPSKLTFTDLLIEPNAEVLFKNYSNVPSNCRWGLDVNQLVLKSGAKMKVGCHLALTGDKVIMKENTRFTITGNDLVSNFSLNNLEMNGTFLPGIASVGNGISSVVIHDKGVLRLRPYDPFGASDLAVNGQLLFETDVFIRGRAPAVSSKITVGIKGRLQFAITSLPPLSSSVPFLNGSSLVHAQDVTIAGELLAKQLRIDPGWRALTIDSRGKFVFHPVNPFSFDTFLVHGNFTSIGAIHLKGLSQSTIPHLRVGSSGVVNIISSLNTSIIHADDVTIAGKVFVNKLSIDPGWKTLTVESTGTFQFDPVNPFSTDKATIDGKLTSLNALTLKGLSQSKVSQLSVGSTGVVSIPSKGVTTFRCDVVVIEGEVRIGLLDIDSGWKELNVSGIKGQFHFEANTSYNIDKVSVSGLIQTSTVFEADKPFTAQNFTVLSGGTVSIHHRGSPSGINQGALDTTLFVNTLQVDGVLKSGSLHINASLDVLLGTSGRVYVSGGGCAGGQGPGAGRGSSSGGSGANYGGRGGRGGGATALDKTYGDIFSIGTWGSGGGHGGSAGSGGRGGGRIHLFVKRMLNVDGQIEMNGDPGKSNNAGGGSGGSLWAESTSFTGTGLIKSIGGNGIGSGGGGGGGRINVYYVTGGFHSRGTIANGGQSSSENGGPGVVYLQGSQPLIKNLRIDNKGLQAVVSKDGDYKKFISSGAVAYLNPPKDGFQYDFTHIEVYGTSHLVFPRLNTHVKVHTIYGDDSSYIHVAPTTTLEMTSVSEYRRINVTWAPYIYSGGTIMLPNGTVEFRQAESLEYPKLARSSHVSIWGRVVGNKAHLMVGYGGTISFETSSPRDLTFVGITIQKNGRLVLESAPSNESNQWNINIVKDYGPVGREGIVTIEGEGRTEARSLRLKAESIVVDPVGVLTLDGKGELAGQGSGAGLGSVDGSGAGYGGRGGSGVSTQQTGSTYGDFQQPRVFGSGGGGPGSKGGAGGGFLELEVIGALIVEGTITSSGQSGQTSHTGGGSGGSILIHSHALEGSGVIAVNGGNGNGNGGGGGGGRMAIHWKDREWWFGSLTSFGGTGPRNGGPGTVFLQDKHIGINNRTLIIDNRNLAPFTAEINFALPDSDSGRAWLLPIGKEYELEEVHILRGAHLALHPNITRPHGLKVHKFVGDRTGVLHVGPNQIVVGQFADHEKFEVNVYVQRTGHLHLPPTFTCFGIQITNRGHLMLERMTVSQGCRLYLGLTGTTKLANKEGIFQFHSLTVADGGEVTSTSDVDNNTLTMLIGDVNIQGGGDFHMKRLYFEVGNLTIDDLGKLRTDFHDAKCTVGQGVTGTASSGAGHGGNGGVGHNQPRVGIAYGHVYQPAHFGCRGGGNGGGLGGGIVNITVGGNLRIDGTLGANGESSRSVFSGGGSGGSIYITTNVLQGYGVVQVNGGNGHQDSSHWPVNGGGGAGGRIAVYFKSNRTFSGSFQSLGGNGRSDGYAGGPGTIFFYHLQHKHRTLLISNAGRKPLTGNQQVIQSYADVSLVPGRAWLLPSSGDHPLAGDQQYVFEELQIYGGAHLAILTKPHNRSASIFFRHMIGDRTGTVHIGYNQTMDLARENIDLPFSVRVYRGGFLGLAPVTTVHGVGIYLDGVLSYVKNITLHHDGLLSLNENSRTGNEHAENDFKLDFITVQYKGLLRMLSNPATHPGMNLTVKLLHVEGGGLVEGSDLRVLAENVSINADGLFSLNGRGYTFGHGTSVGVNGPMNKGRGSLIDSSSVYNGASGGGYGGTGGRGKTSPTVGLPYGNLYEPSEFGSSGGKGSGTAGSGGGRLFLNVTHLLEVDGILSADGGAGQSQAGGGSGGSVWIFTNILKGYGSIRTNGGNPGVPDYNGGGAGGRLAVYFSQNKTFTNFTYQAHGGKSKDGLENVESGGPGTIFLYHLYHNHRTLIVDNDGRAALNRHIDYSKIHKEGGKAWIMPESGIHKFADKVHKFHFEELQIYGKAHLAVWPREDNDTRNISIFFKYMIGDRSGMVHIGNKQVMDLYRPEIDLPFSAYIYSGGHLGLAPVTFIHGVEIIIRGVLAYVKNITIHHGGKLWLQHGGRTHLAGIHKYEFDTVRVQDAGLINGITSPVNDPGIHFYTRAVFIEGGGLIHATRLTFVTENITIDDGGSLIADGLGYNNSHGYKGSGLYGKINPGHGMDSNNGASGAGHGGSGGRGYINGGTPLVGQAYGDLYEPDMFGSAGGKGSGNVRGGNGGGMLWMNVTNVIDIDGIVSAHGESATDNYGGGGSGGSIWMYCKTIQGYGKITANGGHGSMKSYPGGGGAGGRIAIYFQENKTSTYFIYEARGGAASGCQFGKEHLCQAEAGGPGTVFLYHMIHTHRTLLIHNGNQKPLVSAIGDYNDLSKTGCVAWLLPQSSLHHFAKGQGDFHFEELQIYGGGHLAVLTDPVGKNATIFFNYMIGDRTGTLHVSTNQVMDLKRPEIDLPFSVHVYDKGFLGLAPYTIVHGVTLYITGTVAYIQNMTLHHGGTFWKNDGGRTDGQINNTFSFDTVRVQDKALMRALTSPVFHHGATLQLRALFIEGGGVVRGTRYTILAENITIDDGGQMSANGLGHNGSHPKSNSGLRGPVNVGIGASSSVGSSGAGHGGRSGRGAGAAVVGQAFGDLYEPVRFGSNGGGNKAGAGGGVIWFNVTNIIQIDGEVTANGAAAKDANSAGGSGGSIWMHSYIIKGRGNITANGGSGGTNSGGGAGGRIAVYFTTNTTFIGRFKSCGGSKGNTGNTEAGGPGTAFLYHMVHTHRTLLVDNCGQHPITNRISSYSDLSQDGCRAAILPESGIHEFANQSHAFHFEELQIYGGAHLTVQSNPVDREISMFFKYMIGDRTGFVHIGRNQVINLKRHFLDIPFSAYIYDRGYLGLSQIAEMNKIAVHVEGTLDHIQNLTILNGGALHCYLTGFTGLEPKRTLCSMKQFV